PEGSPLGDERRSRLANLVRWRSTPLTRSIVPRRPPGAPRRSAGCPRSVADPAVDLPGFSAVPPGAALLLGCTRVAAVARWRLADRGATRAWACRAHGETPRACRAGRAGPGCRD